MATGYNPDTFIKFDRRFFSAIKAVNDPIAITEALSVYFILLTKKDWRNNLLVSSAALLNLLNKDKRFLGKLNTLLLALKAAKFIEFTGNKLKLNDLIEIHVILPDNYYVEIRAVNEDILGIDHTLNNATILALFCYLATKQGNNFTQVAMATIAEDLKITDTTVDKYLRFMEEYGLIHTIHGKYDPETKRKTSNRYYLHDIDKRVDNANYFKARSGNKSGGREIEAQENEIIEWERNSRIIEKMIKTGDYCPALLIGNYAAALREREKNNYRQYKEVDSDNIDGIIETYKFQRYEPNDKALILDLGKVLAIKDQSRLLVFIEQCNRPIIFLCNYDNMMPAFVSRMNTVIKSPIKPITRFNFLNLATVNRKLSIMRHYPKYEKRKKSFLSRNAPTQYVTEYLLEGRTQSVKAVDSLIYKLSGGRTYLEVNMGVGEHDPDWKDG